MGGGEGNTYNGNSNNNGVSPNNLRASGSVRRPRERKW